MVLRLAGVLTTSCGQWAWPLPRQGSPVTGQYWRTFHYKRTSRAFGRRQSSDERGLDAPDSAITALQARILTHHSAQRLAGFKEGNTPMLLDTGASTTWLTIMLAAPSQGVGDHLVDCRAGQVFSLASRCAREAQHLRRYTVWGQRSELAVILQSKIPR